MTLYTNDKGFRDYRASRVWFARKSWALYWLDYWHEIWG